ncbi:MAG: hypothetical protein J2P13_05265, partial [Acidobacteria bacterium]|nr:hypothetical protein [Acidobacteriota bacterium]
QTYNDIRGGKMVYCDSCQRILYFDPSKEAAPEEKAGKAGKTARRRAHPKIDSSLAWYYRHEYADWGEVFLSFANSGGMAARRIFDAATGRKLGETLVREGGYRQAFPEDLEDSIRLNGSWTDAQQDEWGDELPTSALDVLQRDLDLARAEAAGPRKEAVSEPSSVAS